MVHGSPPYGNETLQAPLEGLRPVIRPRSSSMKNTCLLEDKTRKTACNVRSWLYVREESKVTCQVPASPLPLVRCPINHSAAQAGDYEVSTIIRGHKELARAQRRNADMVVPGIRRAR